MGAVAGFEAAAVAWESSLLPLRVEGYRSELLDSLCLGGSVAWGRLSAAPRESIRQPSRATPLALFPREQRDALVQAALDLRGEEPPPLILDVRSRSSYERDGAQIPSSVRVLPDRVSEWDPGDMRVRLSVAYCT